MFHFALARRDGNGILERTMQPIKEDNRQSLDQSTQQGGADATYDE